nr:hypothetical protein [Tanacetum cinerariifolium]
MYLIVVEGSGVDGFEIRGFEVEGFGLEAFEVEGFDVEAFEVEASFEYEIAFGFLKKVLVLVQFFVVGSSFCF